MWLIIVLEGFICIIYFMLGKFIFMFNVDVVIIIWIWFIFFLKDREILDLYFGSVKEWWIFINLFCGVCGFLVECVLFLSLVNSNLNILVILCIVEEKMIVFGVRMFWFFYYFN